MTMNRSAPALTCVPLAAKISAPVFTQPQRPCHVYIDIAFSAPSKVRFVVFRNFYTAFITIKQRLDEQSVPSRPKFKTILKNYTLMKDPHFEMDSQSWHTISHELFTGGTDLDAVMLLRIYLFQPSPNWKAFELRDIAVYSTDFLPQPPLRKMLEGLEIGEVQPVKQLTAKRIAAHLDASLRFGTEAGSLLPAQSSEPSGDGEEEEIVSVRTLVQ